MLQLPRVGWRLLACQNGASPDCIIVVVVVVVVVVVDVVVVVVFMSALCVCITTSHAHATESKANYYSLHAKPGDVGQCNLKLSHPYPVTQRRPIATMMTLMQHMKITN